MRTATLNFAARGSLLSTLTMRNGLLVAAVALWIGASCCGMAMLVIYANSPGMALEAPQQWPADANVSRSGEGATLLLFAHPRCPCTRATLGELEKIMAHFPGSVTPWIIFFKPAGSDERWDQTDLRATAAAIPGARILSDVDGAEARRFNATTSGQTLLYDSGGNLLFNGGITLARGHAGDNAGRSAIEANLASGTVECAQTPVFGCPIAVSSKE